MQLFLLAHAGGNASVYQAQYKTLLRGLTLVPLDLPGHGRQMGRPPENRMAPLIDHLGHQVEQGFAAGSWPSDGPPPYALFGHSMGALQAYLLAAWLMKRGHPPAERLFLSSSCAPGAHRIPPHFLGLADAQLWRESSRYFGGMTREEQEHEDLRALFAPILRADLTAVVNYRPGAAAALPIAITAWYGEHDIVDAIDMRSWQQWTTQPLRLHRVPGDHFHPLHNPATVAGILLQDLEGGGPG